MKLTFATTASLIAIAAAAPAELEKRQSQYCFVFARGSTEPAPLGILIGPPLQSALAKSLPGLKSYPVQYAASLATNVSNDRTDAASIKKGVEAFNQAKGCKVIVAGGYSQGAAVMHNVIGKSLDPEVKKKIAGVALFGDTRNKQDGGHIPNFPPDRSKVWCNPSDGVCGGQLNVNGGHLSYSGSQINEAAKYLATQAKAVSASNTYDGGKAGSPWPGLGGFGGGAAPGGGAPKGGAPKGGAPGGGAPKGKGAAPPKSSGGDSAPAESSGGDSTPAPAEESSGSSE